MCKTCFRKYCVFISLLNALNLIFISLFLYCNITLVFTWWHQWHSLKKRLATFFFNQQNLLSNTRTRCTRYGKQRNTKGARYTRSTQPTKTPRRKKPKLHVKKPVSNYTYLMIFLLLFYSNFLWNLWSDLHACVNLWT